MQEPDMHEEQSRHVEEEHPKLLQEQGFPWAFLLSFEFVEMQ
jgi:hypothetical protein